jgi:hypothetical protein
LLTATSLGPVLATLAVVALVATIGLITLPDRISRLDWNPTRTEG